MEKTPLSHEPVSHVEAAETQEPQESRRLKLWSQRMREQAGITYLALFAGLGGAGSVEAKTHKAELETTVAEQGWEAKWPDGHLAFFYKDDKGETRFNPWSLIAPFQIEVSRDIKEEMERTAHLPYEYSRGFDTATSVDPEGQERLVQYVDQEVEKQLADVLYGFARSKEVYGLHHEQPGLQDVRITRIAVTGLASPEGPEHKGANTLEQEAIDQENIALGELRASHALEAMREGFARKGISADQLEAAAMQVQGEELQFSESEQAELAELAKDENGVDSLEKIFNLIRKYNNNEPLEHKGRLDEILSSKRGVKITVSYEGDKSETLIIPVPLLLFIPLLLPRRRKGEDQKPAQPERPDRPIPDKVRETKLPPSGTPEYEDMEEKTWIDDLYVFTDHRDALRRGLSYRGMISRAANAYDSYADNESRELYWTTEILEAWKHHDRKAREEAGVSEAELDKGLDYENQEQQARWARMHAKALLELAQAAQGKKDDERYDAITNALERRTTALLGRRITRYEDRRSAELN
ncbi:MAG: hypothetical protein AAB463_00965 [Patescibacteria group bacterium]